MESVHRPRPVRKQQLLKFNERLAFAAGESRAVRNIAAAVDEINFLSDQFRVDRLLRHLAGRRGGR